jgi:clan AA aspartic protease
MIRGFVNARHEAAIRLKVRGPGGVESDVDAIIDSGFTSTLTLPLAIVTALGLVRQSSSRAVLADGSIRRFEIYTTEVEWCGAWRPVLVLAVGDATLVGMDLLAGHKLMIDVVPGGLVEIVPIP